MISCLLPVKVIPVIFPHLHVSFMCRWKRNEQKLEA